MLTDRQLKAGRKAHNFWANQRSTAKLVTHSPYFTEPHARQLLEELSSTLDEGILIYPKVYRNYAIDEKTKYRDKRRYLGLPEACYFPTKGEAGKREREFNQFMQDAQHSKKCRDWQWRASEHAQQMQEQGWYPFFVTLTVDPKIGDPYEVWKPKSREFRDYITALCNVVTDTLGVERCNKPPYRSQSNYITYMGSIEHGKSREHHHGHFMIWLKEIPEHWKIDPNLGMPQRFRTRRECKQMREFWKWSNQPEVVQALYFRSKGDIWSSKHEHCTPIDAKSQQPIQIKGVRAVGAYITKYIQKDAKEWKHRIKATRNLGMNRLKEKLQTMTPEQLEALSWRPQNHRHHHSVNSTHSVPLGLVRSLATLMAFSHKWAQSQQDLKTLMKSNSDSYNRMRKSVHDGARPSRMPSLDCYDWVQSHLPDQSGYCKDRLLAAHRLLADSFPRETMRVTPTVLGANQYATPSIVQTRSEKTGNRRARLQ